MYSSNESVPPPDKKGQPSVGVDRTITFVLNAPATLPAVLPHVCVKLKRANINPRRECWFIVDTKWLQSWAKFVRGEGPPPGRISNEGAGPAAYSNSEGGYIVVLLRVSWQNPCLVCK